jgi:hypothetical protein
MPHFLSDRELERTSPAEIATFPVARGGQSI